MIYGYYLILFSCRKGEARKFYDENCTNRNPTFTQATSIPPLTASPTENRPKTGLKSAKGLEAAGGAPFLDWLKQGGRGDPPTTHAPWMTADSGYRDDNSGTDNTRGIGTANSNWPAEVQRLEARKRHLVRQTNITVCRCQPDCVQCVGHYVRLGGL